MEKGPAGMVEMGGTSRKGLQGKVAFRLSFEAGE